MLEYARICENMLRLYTEYIPKSIFRKIQRIASYKFKNQNSKSKCGPCGSIL